MRSFIRLWREHSGFQVVGQSGGRDSMVENQKPRLMVDKVSDWDLEVMNLVEDTLGKIETGNGSTANGLPPSLRSEDETGE